jgi:hypothetical protein
MSEATGVSETAGAKTETGTTGGGVGLVPLVLIVLGTVVMVLGAVGGGVYWLS